MQTGLAWGGILHDMSTPGRTAGLAATPLSQPGSASVALVERPRTPAVVYTRSVEQLQPPPALHGRRDERRLIDQLLEQARGGQSHVLVVRGEPGIGKTALVDYAIESAADLRVSRTAGVEPEMELAFGALHQFCLPFLDRLEELPPPQRDALQTVFGLSAGPAPDRFLVGLAVLSLLSAAAKDCPLLCVVDDAQWLDQASAQALTFAARRLQAESVLLLFVTREADRDFRGLRELVVEGLRESDARELLGSAMRGPMDVRIREQIVAETRGNPLALLELPRGLSPAELAGGFALPGALPLSDRIEETLVRRLEALPHNTRLALLVAAAEPTGDEALLWAACGRLGTSTEALEPAERAGLIELRPQVRFRHPLVRSAVYRAASPRERQKVHGALGTSTDRQVDPDRRAWHLAQAASCPDEEVAADLERCAGRAQQRGGLAAAAAFLERAVALTLEERPRAQRALAAACAKHLAGASDAALALLATAQAGPLDELERARVDLLRAEIEQSQNRGGDAAGLLLAAAERFKPLDARLARETYLQGLSAASFAARRSHGRGVKDIAQAALTAPPAPKPARACDLLLDGLTTRFTAGYADAAPTVKSALKAFPSEETCSEEELRWLCIAGRAAVDAWDDEAWEALTIRHLQLVREAGALTVLPLALSQRIAALTFAGRLDAASSLREEIDAAAQATESKPRPYGALVLAGWRGCEAPALRIIETIVDELEPRGERLGLTLSQWSSAVLYNGLGLYDKAFAAAERASEHPEDLAVYGWGLVELIVAAVRSGKRERAADALARLEEITRASGTDWALGVEARSRALLSDGDTAERLYREAIERLGRTRMRVELARAHLLFGEWLRRERRRVDARDQLRTAHQMFTAMGVEAFAGRAERELLATGERARRRSIEARDNLTAQEAQIARLARDGHSNPEIGSRLFISPRTVEYHLHKIFRKLDIGSRGELESVLSQ